MHKLAVDKLVLLSQRAEGISGVKSIIAVPCRAVGHGGGE